MITVWLLTTQVAFIHSSFKDQPQQLFRPTGVIIGLNFTQFGGGIKIINFKRIISGLIDILIVNAIAFHS